MVLLIGIVLAVYVSWQTRHFGLYIAFCDAVGVTLACVAAVAYAGPMTDLVPIEHPLRGTICMLCIFLVGWLMFRTPARSFPGDRAVEFRRIDHIGAMIVAFGGTMMFVGMVSLLFLTTGELLDKIAWLEGSLRQTAGYAISACRFVAFFAGSQEPITLDTVINATG